MGRYKMRKLNFNLKSKFQKKCLFACIIMFAVAVYIGIIATIQTNYENRKGTIEITEFELPKDSMEEAIPLIDISYEDMRAYVFSDNDLLVITFPKYLQVFENGDHMVITIDKNKIVKAVMIRSIWSYYTIYCKEANLPFFEMKKEKPKLKKGY